MEATVEQKLKALYKLQSIDSKIDEVKAQRGELPLEVADLEDDVAQLETRFANQSNEMKEMETTVANNKIAIKEGQALVKKYETQMANVKNNREYDALNKEVEMQGLLMQAADKKSKELVITMKYQKEMLEQLEEEIKGRKVDLDNKKAELDTIVEETEKEEAEFNKLRKKASAGADERLMAAYTRIRGNMRNGIAVAKIERDSCSGCFAGIPPQRQIDIKQRKKVTVCESCGRILVDSDMAEETASAMA